jgi:Clr5 domain
MQTENNFKATKKMYKSRLAAWGIRKYMTRAEGEVACRVLKLKHRNVEALGKIIVRGKARNPDVFLRHMGQSRTGSWRRQLLQNVASLHEADIVIEGMERQPLHLIFRSPIYPPGSGETIEAIGKDLTYLVLATSEAPEACSYALSNLLNAAINRPQ